MARKVLTEGDRLAEHYGVASHWNLFNYVECSKCKERYVREWGWTFYRHGWPWLYPARTHVCKQCCITDWCAAVWAEKFEAEKRDRPRMPQVKPPAPPMAREIRSC